MPLTFFHTHTLPSTTALEVVNGAFAGAPCAPISPDGRALLAGHPFCLLCPPAPRAGTLQLVYRCGAEERRMQLPITSGAEREVRAKDGVGCAHRGLSQGPPPLRVRHRLVAPAPLLLGQPCELLVTVEADDGLRHSVGAKTWVFAQRSRSPAAELQCNDFLVCGPVLTSFVGRAELRYRISARRLGLLLLPVVRIHPLDGFGPHCTHADGRWRL